METVKSLEDIDLLEINQVKGSPNLVNSQIIFKGYNNTLYCESGVNLNNSLISFEGNNSLVYLSGGDYPINLYLRDNSTVYFGRDNKIISNVNINIQESQNFIIGDDGIIASGVNIRSFDGFPIYDSMTKERINLSDSIIIGDHVWLDHLSYISKGARIGSGAIVGNHAFVAPSTKILSNTYVLGNPVQVVEKNVFFTKDFTGIFNEEDTAHSLSYPSDIYIYEFVNKETLDLNYIDKILKDLIVEDRLEFIQKLFVRNKRKNRFTII